MTSTEYYEASAAGYDALHGVDNEDHEHSLALTRSVERFFPEARTIMDVGCGTGRGLHWFERFFAERDIDDYSLIGVEPSSEMLKIAATRVQTAKLIEGKGESLPFEDGSVDVAIATGILHHVDHPKTVIAEMLRVARHGIIISDHNNFAFGSSLARRIRLALYAVGLLPAFLYVKQGFKRQGYSEGDGWWYPYSVLNDFDAISKGCSEWYLGPTRKRNSRTHDNLLLSQSHVFIAGVK